MDASRTIKKIVVIGPESTGKSTLCAALAEHYNTRWVKEYARGYLDARGPGYQFSDLTRIARGQLASEDAMTAEIITRCSTVTESEPILFIDTDLYVLKIWSEFVFNRIDNHILTNIAARKYDLYLLCNIDLPWVQDGLREYPDIRVRQKLMKYYVAELSAQEVPWVLISGAREDRVQQAVQAIGQWMHLPDGEGY